jgi:hypothetical protein
MKFISSEYDPKLGVSHVIMQHLGKKFFGNADLHPDDIENASEFAGCALAEMRATVAALKYERKLAKQKSDEAWDFIKACESYAKFDPESDTAKVIYRQLNRRIKRVNDLTDQINDLLEKIATFGSRRQIVLDAIKRRKEMTKEDK